MNAKVLFHAAAIAAALAVFDYAQVPSSDSSQVVQTQVQARPVLNANSLATTSTQVAIPTPTTPAPSN